MIFTELMITGFLLGIRHALEADHIAAIAALSVSKKSNTPLFPSIAKIATVWSCGHSLSVLLAAGILYYVLDMTLNDTVTKYLEIFVGIMLVILGINVARKIMVDRLHIHVHQHNRSRHIHFHLHKNQAEPHHQLHDDDDHHHEHKVDFFMGALHGLAGSGILIAIVAQSHVSWIEGIVYLLTFSLGILSGMVLFSSMIISPSLIWLKKANRFHYALMIAIATGSTLVGIQIILANTLY